jgi:hypothetical protein
LIGLGAAVRLIAGPAPQWGSLSAGLCVGLGAALHVAGGVPLWAAAALAAAALAAAIVLRRPGGDERNSFRDAALIAATLGAPAVGLAGDLIYGWHSATVLNRGAVVIAPAIPLWALAIVGAALIGGVIKGIWVRR